MHTYATARSRVAVYGLIAVPAVVLAWAIVTATSSFDWPQWLVSAPSLAGTYSVLYALVDRVLWKLPLMQQLGLIDVPDVSGTYAGSLASTYLDEAGQPTRRDVEFRITQTWTEICIEMSVKGDSSSSISESATGSLTRNGDSVRLLFVYRNRVNPGIADADMADHTGAAELNINLDGRMSGRYFNSRPRAGTVEAHKV